MNVRELITDAYYLSTVVARNLETPTGAQISDGLTLLNDILAEKSSDGRFIPFYDRVSFAAVAGQQSYWIDDLVQIETFVTFLDTVRFPMVWDNRRNFWGSARVEDVQSLPYFYYSERQIHPDTYNNGTRIYVYFLPSDQGYTFQVNGRFNLTLYSSLSTEISQHLQTFYLSYLKYKLADRICDFNTIELSPKKIDTLYKLEKLVDDINPIDVTLKKISQFPDVNGFNWGDVNLGHGWRP